MTDEGGWGKAQKWSGKGVRVQAKEEDRHPERGDTPREGDRTLEGGQRPRERDLRQTEIDLIYIFKSSLRLLCGSRLEQMPG